MSKPRVASLFAGIGGICQGFINAGCKIVYANEIDKNACRTYRENFDGAPYLHEGDVYNQHLNKKDRIDILTAGFPCQAFSIAGYRKGFEDERGVLYTEVHRLIDESKPKAVFYENVKNLQSHDHGRTYRIIKEGLEDLGYSVTELVMNTCDYSDIPQNRERIYVVAFKNNKKGECPAIDNFSFPDKTSYRKTLREMIDFSYQPNDYYYYDHNHKYYPLLDQAIDDPDTVYQWRRVYVRKNKKGMCPTLTANMGTGGHNVPIIRDDHDIRKLTEYECLAFQGFPENFHFPDSVARGQRYKQIGNSVSVPVVKIIAENIVKALNK